MKLLLSKEKKTFAGFYQISIKNGANPVLKKTTVFETGQLFFLLDLLAISVIDFGTGDDVRDTYRAALKDYEEFGYAKKDLAIFVTSELTDSDLSQFNSNSSAVFKIIDSRGGGNKIRPNFFEF